MKAKILIAVLCATAASAYAAPVVVVARPVVIARPVTVTAKPATPAPAPAKTVAATKSTVTEPVHTPTTTPVIVQPVRSSSCSDERKKRKEC